MFCIFLRILLLESNKKLGGQLEIRLSVCFS